MRHCWVDLSSPHDVLTHHPTRGHAAATRRHVGRPCSPTRRRIPSPSLNKKSNKNAARRRRRRSSTMRGAEGEGNGRRRRSIDRLKKKRRRARGERDRNGVSRPGCDGWRGAAAFGGVGEGTRRAWHATAGTPRARVDTCRNPSGKPRYHYYYYSGWFFPADSPVATRLLMLTQTKIKCGVVLPPFMNTKCSRIKHDCEERR